jgi:methionine-rich copper-binding protein CopC
MEKVSRGSAVMPRILFAALAALVLGAFTVPSATAHALLRHAEPAMDSTVKTAPTELLLVFSEPVESSFSRVEVTDMHGARADAGTVRADPKDGRRLLVPLKTMAPGKYTVTWHATSADTHKTQGSFVFTVAP